MVGSQRHKISLVASLCLCACVYRGHGIWQCFEEPTVVVGPDWHQPTVRHAMPRLLRNPGPWVAPQRIIETPDGPIAVQVRRK